LSVRGAISASEANSARTETGTIDTSTSEPASGVSLGDAVGTFLSTITAASTRKSYGIALSKLSVALETEAGAEALGTWFLDT
jgi:hypothetical protein